MKIIRSFISFCVSSAALVFLLIGPVGLAQADWVSSNCVGLTPHHVSSWSKVDAGNYSASALYEGYHWGGGCWNNNNVDDSPGEVPETLTPRGEGPDCSGIVFKTWAITSSGTISKTFYPQMYFTHGPYASGHFKSTTTAWTKRANKNVPSRWDAYASNTHIGMIWVINSDGTIVMIEAKAEAYGTGSWLETYQGNPSFVQTARNGWD